MPDFDTRVSVAPSSRYSMYSRSAASAAAWPEIQARVFVGEAGGNRNSLLNDVSDSRDLLAQKIAAFQWTVGYDSAAEKCDAIQKGFAVMRKWKTVLFSPFLQHLFSEKENKFLTSIWSAAWDLEEVKKILDIFCLGELRYLQRFWESSKDLREIKGLIFTWDELKVMDEARDVLLGKELLWELVLEIYESAKNREGETDEPGDDFRRLAGLTVQQDMPDNNEKIWTTLFFNHTQGVAPQSRTGLLFWGEFFSTSERPVSISIVDHLPNPIRHVPDENRSPKGSLIQLKQAAAARWAAPGPADDRASATRPVVARETEAEDVVSVETEWDEWDEFIPPYRWF